MTTPHEKIDSDSEFNDPNVNYRVLMAELRERIEDIQQDLLSIRDSEVRGHALKIYTQLKNNYFDLMARSIELEHKMIVERNLSSIEHSLEGGNESE